MSRAEVRAPSASVNAHPSGVDTKTLPRGPVRRSSSTTTSPGHRGAVGQERRLRIGPHDTNPGTVAGGKSLEVAPRCLAPVDSAEELRRQWGTVKARVPDAEKRRCDLLSPLGQRATRAPSRLDLPLVSSRISFGVASNSVSGLSRAEPLDVFACCERLELVVVGWLRVTFETSSGAVGTT